MTLHEGSMATLARTLPLELQWWMSDRFPLDITKLTVATKRVLLQVHAMDDRACYAIAALHADVGETEEALLR